MLAGSSVLKCPFVLVLIFPGASFPQMPICPNVHRSQSAHLPPMPFALVLIFPGAHFPQVQICPNAAGS